MQAQIWVNKHLPTQQPTWYKIFYDGTEYDFLERLNPSGAQTTNDDNLQFAICNDLQFSVNATWFKYTKLDF